MKTFFANVNGIQITVNGENVRIEGCSDVRSYMVAAVIAALQQAQEVASQNKFDALTEKNNG